MTMHNPPHPGEFIREVYMAPFGISSRQLASSLGVSPSTLSRLLKGDREIRDRFIFLPHRKNHTIVENHCAYFSSGIEAGQQAKRHP